MKSSRTQGMFIRFVIALLAIMTFSCPSSPVIETFDHNSDDPIVDEDVVSDSGVSNETDMWNDTVSDDEFLDGFFGLEAIHQIQIEVDGAGIESLITEPKVYVPGSVRIGDVLFEEVGVRLKGGVGSFVPLNAENHENKGNGAPGKAGFIVDFNRYVKGQDYHGLKKLTLNNMVQDPSGLNQFLGYTVFREMGIPASRSGFGQVSLNGTSKGLYALIETPDNDAFLEKWYGSDKGNLYEGAGGSDLVGENVDAFDQDNGEDLSKQDLHDLAVVLDAIGPDEDAWDVLVEVLDMDQYLNFAATELYLAHWDGYTWSRNNFIIHHDTVGGGWTFLPWGIDQLFRDEDMLGAYSGVMKSPGPSWEPPAFGIDSMFHGGRVHTLCISSGTCRTRLAEVFEAVIQRVEEMDLRSLAAETRVIVEPLLLEESSKYGDPEGTEAALDQVFLFLDTRAELLSGWLACLTGGSVDHDNDTYDGCTVDCDDWIATTHPGAQETCNLVDDDCNAVIDDPEGCPKCVDVSENLDGNYSFCFEQRSWYQARQYCLDRGQNLASFHELETAVLAGWYFLGLVGVTEAWIGLNDIETEGTYAWTDGTSVDFEHFVIDFPHDWDEYLDCVYHHALLGWLPHLCYKVRAFICRD